MPTMRAFLLFLLACIICTSAFQIKMEHRDAKPCKGKLCYEKYLSKMQGFLNITGVPFNKTGP